MTAPMRLLKALTACVLCVGAAFLSGALSAGPVDEAFDVNDISFLWPVPKTKSDVDALLSGNDLLADGKGIVWPTKLFKQVIEAAEATGVADAQGTIRRITLGAEKNGLNDPANWKVAGVRIDPSAPGCAPQLVAARGSMPQVRLILQPVTLSAAGNPVVHDLTSHLVFNFGKTGPDKKNIPDKDAFQAIVNDLKAIKSKLKATGISTKGPLDVHPGFGGAGAAAFAMDLKGLLKKHLGDDRIGANAFMGLAPAPEPWVFFSLAKIGDSFVPFPSGALGGRSSQMFVFGGRIFPEPTPKNLDASKGVSTRILFDSKKTTNLKDPVFENGERPLLEDVADIVANPGRAHFFNTDCISCHTETRRRLALKIDVKDLQFRFERQGHIADAILPRSDWNLRNFGWFGTKATATHRTGNEAVESVEFINRAYLKLE